LSVCSDAIRGAIQRASASQADYMTTRGVTATQRLTDAWGEATRYALDRANGLTYTNATIQAMSITGVEFVVTDCHVTSQGGSVNGAQNGSQNGTSQVTVNTRERWYFTADLVCRPSGTQHSAVRIDDYPAEEYVLVDGGALGWQIKAWYIGQVMTIAPWACPG
jgi:hypothetical protein